MGTQVISDQAIVREAGAEMQTHIPTKNQIEVLLGLTKSCNVIRQLT
jgi:hypothetical protein